MINLLLKLLKLNRIPEVHLHAIEQQGIILKSENVSGHIYFRNYKAPGKFYMKKKVWFKGSLFLTQQSFYGFAFNKTIINVPVRDTRFSKLNISLPKPNIIDIQFDPHLFNADSSGDIICRFKTSEAQSFSNRLKQLSFD